MNAESICKIRRIIKQSAKILHIKDDSKNHPKMDQNYIPKPSKSRLGGTKIEVQKAPGQVWTRLGLSWAIQSVFGGFLGRLGGVLEGFRRPHSGPEAPKSRP